MGAADAAPSDADARALRLDGAWPYWLRATRAVANDVDWEGLWLLTALEALAWEVVADADDGSERAARQRRAMAAENRRRCRGTTRLRARRRVRRGGGVESSFAQEVDDLHVMTTECTPRSLVMLDEIGRGSSTVEGAALSAALLEWLDTRRIGCLFATQRATRSSVAPRAPRRRPPLASLRRVPRRRAAHRRRRLVPVHAAGRRVQPSRRRCERRARAGAFPPASSPAPRR